MNDDLKITIEQYVGGQLLRIQTIVSESAIARAIDEIGLAELAFRDAYHKFKYEKDIEVSNLQYKPKISPWGSQNKPADICYKTYEGV